MMSVDGSDGSDGIKRESSLTRTSCNSCRYFYITWNNKRPYGCRAMGFMSTRLPSVVVLEIEGRDCLSYEGKDTELSDRKRLQNHFIKGNDGNKKVNVIV